MELEFPLGVHSLIVGTTGSGKTNISAKIFKDVYDDDIVQIWFDLEEDFDQISRIADETVYSLDDILEVIKTGATKIHYEEESPFMETQFKDWNLLCQMAFELKECVVLCDEIMQVCELWGIAPWHQAVLSRGRKRQVSLIQATQRTQNIHKNLVALSWVRIGFWVDSYDQRALKDWYPELKWLDDKPDYWFVYKYKRNTQLCKPLPDILGQIRAHKVGRNPYEKLDR